MAINDGDEENSATDEYWLQTPPTDQSYVNKRLRQKIVCGWRNFGDESYEGVWKTSIEGFKYYDITNDG